MEKQAFDGKISYIDQFNNTDSYPFKILGQFTDDNFDEFTGTWIEEGILHNTIISLEEIREIV